MFEKYKIDHSWGLNVLNMYKHFKFVSSLEHVNFAINGKYSQKNYDYYACFTCDFSNIQKCNFKESQFTWVTLLTIFLPFLLLLVKMTYLSCQFSQGQKTKVDEWKRDHIPYLWLTIYTFLLNSYLFKKIMFDSFNFNFSIIEE
jgi:hypothetical protein